MEKQYKQDESRLRENNKKFYANNFLIKIFSQNRASKMTTITDETMRACRSEFAERHNPLPSRVERILSLDHFSE